MPGTVSFFFDPQKNPYAFIDGANYNWGTFVIDGDKLDIVSEGQELLVRLNPNTANELMVFQNGVEIDPTNRHMIAVTWDEKGINLYFDGILISQFVLPN